MLAKIDSSFYAIALIDVETKPIVGCSWGGYEPNNFQFLTVLINGIQATEKGVKIYVLRYMWQFIFGSFLVCPTVASQQL
jgi:hypothetical protein